MTLKSWKSNPLILLGFYLFVAAIIALSLSIIIQEKIWWRVVAAVVVFYAAAYGSMFVVEQKKPGSIAWAALMFIPLKLIFVLGLIYLVRRSFPEDIKLFVGTLIFFFVHFVMGYALVILYLQKTDKKHR